MGTRCRAFGEEDRCALEKPKYVGMAPGATLVIAAPGEADGGFQDPDVLIGTEVETPDGEAPSRPRRRRGGRGRGRGREGREGGERDARPDLEARGEDVPLPLEEDSNPSIPTVPEAAAAYKEVVERMSATNAPVFTEAPVSDVSSDARAVPAERARRTESVDGEEPDEVEPVTVAVAATPAPRPAPPVAPVDPSKASFSLLGWLKGGG